MWPITDDALLGNQGEAETTFVTYCCLTLIAILTKKKTMKFLLCAADILYLLTLLRNQTYFSFAPLLRTDELMQAAKAVANVTLSKHLVEVVFALFDENSEFVPSTY